MLRGQTWIIHGSAVGHAKKYLPGSFDRPSRNPAEKINSGYKAQEYLTWIYGLCPALLYGVLLQMCVLPHISLTLAFIYCYYKLDIGHIFASLYIASEFSISAVFCDLSWLKSGPCYNHT